MLVHRIRMKRRGRFGVATRRVGSGAYPSQAAINWVHLYKIIHVHSIFMVKESESKINTHVRNRQ